MASKPQGPGCLHLPNSGISDTCHYFTRVPEIWTHGLFSWDEHFTDSAISGATFLGSILRIIMLTCPEKQEQEDTSMQNEDFTSDLGLTWLQVPCRWGGEKTYTPQTQAPWKGRVTPSCQPDKLSHLSLYQWYFTYQWMPGQSCHAR